MNSKEEEEATRILALLHPSYGSITKLIGVDMKEWTRKMAENDSPEEESTRDDSTDLQMVDTLLGFFQCVKYGKEFTISVLYLKKMHNLRGYLTRLASDGAGTQIFASSREEALQFCSAVLFARCVGGEDDPLKDCIGVFGEDLVIHAMSRMIAFGDWLDEQDMVLFVADMKRRVGFEKSISGLCQLLKILAQSRLCKKSAVCYLAKAVTACVLDETDMEKTQYFKRRMDEHFVSLDSFVTHINIARLVLESKFEEDDDKNACLEMLTERFLVDYMSETSMSPQKKNTARGH